MSKRLTVSLTDRADAKLRAESESREMSPSDIIETALEIIWSLEPTEIERRIREITLQKQVSTPQGWRRAFWTMLAARLGFTQWSYDSRHPYGPVQFERFTVALLFSNKIGVEDGWLHVYIVELPIRIEVSTGSQFNRSYRFTDPVSVAVEDTVAWIEGHGGLAGCGKIAVD
jgi:hypothetical protein